MLALPLTLEKAWNKIFSQDPLTTILRAMESRQRSDPYAISSLVHKMITLTVRSAITVAVINYSVVALKPNTANLNRSPPESPRETQVKLSPVLSPLYLYLIYSICRSDSQQFKLNYRKVSSFSSKAAPH